MSNSNYDAGTCPLCSSLGAEFVVLINQREYLECENCDLVFVDPVLRPDRATEYNHYQNHNNHIGDASYQKFLSTLFLPLIEKLPPHSSGLDYGCGPGPALAYMMEQAGHVMSLYDPCFFPDQGILAETYDFICCSEVVEHFHNPAEEFKRLRKMLKPGGILGVMTSFAPDSSQLKDWYYLQDITHVVFYREKTFCWIAEELEWNVCFPDANLAFLIRN